MCVTNIYVDVYPDGRTRKFSQTSVCTYGLPGRPCAKTSIVENPIRAIGWDEPTTEFMLTQPPRVFPTVPLTPPRSSGGSTHRLSSGYVSSTTSDEGRRRRESRRRSGSSRKEPKREHRRERIVIVDAPPTPRTPPQHFSQAFTAPSSPVARARPIIVDERPRPPRVPSVGAVVGDRPPRRSSSSSRPLFAWDSPSSSHTSFDLQTQAEERAKATARAEAKQLRDERIAELEAEKRRADLIRAHDEAINRRPAVPLAPAPLRNRAFLRPVVDQTEDVQGLMGGLRLDERVPVVGDRLLSTEARRRREQRAEATQLRQEAEEAEAMKQRLRERQMPGRRFSVGPAQRRERVLYSDGVYRWE